ncbi:MAG: MFS transporter [Candidatus Binatia bacterium]
MPLNLQQRMMRPLAALRYRDFRLFYSALLVSALGSQIQSTANIWLIYELTGSPLLLGLTGLARGLPILLFSLIGGVIADRVDRRRLIMLVQAIQGLLGLLLATLALTRVIEVWHIYLITIIASSLSALNAPARGAIIPSLVPGNSLLNALALNSTVWQTSTLVGPALAGISIALLGVAATYAIDGTLHILTLVSLARMRLDPVTARARQSALASLREGLSFVRHQSIITVLLAMDSAAMLFGSYRVLLPIFARDLGVGADGLGLLLSAPAAGSLIGAAVMMSLGDLRYKGLFVAGGILAYCLFLVLLACSPWFLLSLGVAIGLGFFDSVQAIPRNTAIQLITPNELRGRVSSFQSMLTNGAPALGQAQSGAVAAIIGAPLAIGAGAVTCAALILGITAARRDLRAANL